jgi:hypothetical protein
MKYPATDKHFSNFTASEPNSPPSNENISMQPSYESSDEKNGEIDFLSVPKTLEAEFEKLGVASSIRPTKIKLGNKWKFAKMEHIDSPGTWIDMDNATKKNDCKKKAFALLDAITRSGDIPVQDCVSILYLYNIIEHIR